MRPGGPRGRCRLARGGHARGGAGPARGGGSWSAAGLAVRTGRRARPVGDRGRGRLRPVGGADRRDRRWRRGSRSGGRGSISRSTPGCPATAPPRGSGRRSAAPPGTPSRSVPSRSSASGRTWPLPTSPGHPRSMISRRAYEAAYQVALDAGLTPSVRHLSNSAGALLLPQARYDLVRIGIAAYGIDPGTRHRRPGRSPAPTGDAAAGAARERQDHRRGRGCLVRAHLARDGPDHPGPGAPRLRRRHPAARRQHRRGRAGGTDVPPSVVGSAWTSS